MPLLREIDALQCFLLQFPYVHLESHSLKDAKATGGVGGVLRGGSR